jgi:hypothetical protein
LKLIILDDTVNTVVLGFRYNDLLYDIQRYISDNQACDKLSGRKIDNKVQTFVKFPRAGTLLVFVDKIAATD